MDEGGIGRGEKRMEREEDWRWDPEKPWKIWRDGGWTKEKETDEKGRAHHTPTIYGILNQTNKREEERPEKDVDGVLKRQRRDEEKKIKRRRRVPVADNLVGVYPRIVVVQKCNQTRQERDNQVLKRLVKTKK